MARSEAEALGIPMVVSVTDSEGGLQAFYRMDGSLPISVRVAQDKAYTAAILRMPSHRLGELSRPDGPLYGLNLSHDGRICLLGGGYPLEVDGKVAGALGVSGGSLDQDMQVAGAAMAGLLAMKRGAEALRTQVGEKGLDEFAANWREKQNGRSRDYIEELFAGALAPACPAGTF